MQQLIERLHNEKCSCILSNNGHLHLFYNRGVMDLYTLYTSNREILINASIADKVVGKAAAALMILGGVKQIYADTISVLALNMLSNTNIDVQYGECVPYIINRTQTDLCPLEKATKELNSLDDIFDAIECFVKSIA